MNLILFNTAVAVLALNQIKSLTASETGEINKTIVVIGGGVAGLTAASKLIATKKFNVVLLEASDRIGGRVSTKRFETSEHYVEMGAEWIHGQGENPVYKLVAPLGITIDNNTQDFEFVLETGEALNSTSHQNASHLHYFIENDPIDWISNNGSGLSYGEKVKIISGQYKLRFPNSYMSGHLGKPVLDVFHRSFLGLESANNWFEVSASENGEQYEETEGNHNVPWRPPYSYSTLLKLVLTGKLYNTSQEIDLPDWIKLNSEVVSINRENEVVTVQTKQGTTYKADHVVFTPSLGVLKANHDKIFKPELPKQKQKAIQYLGFGSVSKLYLEFEKPWWRWTEGFEGVLPTWNDAKDYESNPSIQYWRSNITYKELLQDYKGLPLWCRSISFISGVDSGSHPNMLLLWSSGVPSRFLEIMDSKYIQDNLMKVLRIFFKGSFIHNPISFTQSKWYSNQFTRGTYSFRTVESDKMDVWARDLAEPIVTNSRKPVICFAGEATHPKYFSTVHAAYDSGIREFQRINDWYDKSSNSCNGLSATYTTFLMILLTLFFCIF